MKTDYSSKQELFLVRRGPVRTEVRGRIALQMLRFEATDSNKAKSILISQPLPDCATGASEGPRSSLPPSVVDLRISKPVSLIEEQRALL